MSITYTIGAVHDKLALLRAIAQGYQITLAEDGCAQVTSPEGNVYFIYNFECDCPDKRLRGGLHQGRCKHEIWISQMTPCPKRQPKTQSPREKFSGAFEHTF
jgi:hypothetical protein